MKKLYRATVEFEFFVVAENDDEAYLTARRYSEDAMDSAETGIFTDEVSELKTIPKDWRNSYPFGKDDSERTCEQILAASTQTV